MNARAIAVFSLVGSLLGLLIACGGSGSILPTAPSSVSAGQVEQQSANMVNRERSVQNVDPELSLEQRVAALARAHSKAMQAEKRLFHDGVDGDLESRLNNAGIQCSYAAENVARVNDAANPAAQAHSLFMKSAAHRRNILSPQVSVLGVGVVRSGDSYWVTQIFIQP